MKLDHGRTGFSLLKKMPQAAEHLYQEVSTNGGGVRVARHFATLAARQPEHMSELTRGMDGNANYPMKALIANSLLMTLAVRGHSADVDKTAFKSLTHIMHGFNRLYLPIATQRPDLALVMTNAALNEPDMNPFVRDQVSVAFANATFALLRKEPEQTVELLQTLVRRTKEPDSHYISDAAREKVVTHLVAVSDRYPAHYGAQPVQGVGGGQMTLPVHVAQAVAEAVKELTDEPLVLRKMDKRLGDMQRRQQQLANA